MNKKILCLFLVTILCAGVSKAQISLSSKPDDKASGTNFFIEASASGGGALNSVGKLFGFPAVDLTRFEFNSSKMENGEMNPSFFDGALIFNTGTGTTKDGQGLPSTVSRGFYYFDNPGAEENESVEGGKWKKLGGTSISSGGGETTTGGDINGKPIYTVSGSFVQAKDKGETQFELAVPKGIKQFYKVTIFNDNVATNTVYSIKPNGDEKAELITGAPNMSVVYPEGTYNYVLEYLKD